MKNLKKWFFFLSILFVAHSLSAKYSVNTQAVDKIISQAKEVKLLNLQGFNETTDLNTIVVQNKKSAFVAWVLTYTLVGFHRLYLGTSAGTFFAYFFTLGGFLVIDIIDYAVLLAAIIDKKDMAKYSNNPHFFMWKE